MAHPLFRALWQTVIDALIADSEFLQVPATAITAGIIEFDNEGNLVVPELSPPFIYVYCIPSPGRLSEADKISERKASIGLLATPVQRDTIQDTICDATELCERIEDAISRKLKHLSPVNPNVAIDKPGTRSIRAVLTFQARYKSTMEPV